MAGVTMFMLSFPLPRLRKMWPSRTRLQLVSLLRSSALAILRVSLRYRLLSPYWEEKKDWSPWM